MKATPSLIDQGGCAACQPPAPATDLLGEPPAAGPSVVLNDPLDPNWVVVEVVGEDGTPLGDEPFRLVLSDGAVIEGRLDRRGRVRIEGVGTGDALLTLPGRDEAAWDRAEQ